MKQAIADIEALVPHYKSQTERTFANLGPTLLGAHFGAEVMLMLYEPLRFALPGGHYTPDFQVVLSDGRVCFVEVKGSKKQTGYTSTRIKLRAAQVMHPYWTWCEVVEEDGWLVVEVGK